MKSTKKVRRNKKYRQRSNKYTIRNKNKSKQRGGYLGLMMKRKHNRIVDELKGKIDELKSEHGRIVDELNKEIAITSQKLVITKNNGKINTPRDTSREILHAFCVTISGGTLENYVKWTRFADGNDGIVLLYWLTAQALVKIIGTSYWKSHPDDDKLVDYFNKLKEESSGLVPTIHYDTDDLLNANLMPKDIWTGIGKYDDKYKEVQQLPEYRKGLALLRARSMGDDYGFDLGEDYEQIK